MLSEINLILNLLGTVGIILLSIFILTIKLRLKRREEELDKKLDSLLILTDKLVEHTQDIKDSAVIIETNAKH